MANALEDESKEAVNARRARRLRQWLVELALVAAFLGSLMGAKRVFEASGASVAATALIALAAAVLALWCFVYWLWIGRLDEFERGLETNSIAVAGAMTIVLAAGWGLFEYVLGAPQFPMVMLAPVFAGAYAVARMLIGARYR